MFVRILWNEMVASLIEWAALRAMMRERKWL